MSFGDKCFTLFKVAVLFIVVINLINWFYPRKLDVDAARFAEMDDSENSSVGTNEGSRHPAPGRISELMVIISVFVGLCQIAHKTFLSHPSDFEPRESLMKRRKKMFKGCALYVLGNTRFFGMSIQAL